MLRISNLKLTFLEERGLFTCWAICSRPLTAATAAAAAEAAEAAAAADEEEEANAVASEAEAEAVAAAAAAAAAAAVAQAELAVAAAAEVSHAATLANSVFLAPPAVAALAATVPPACHKRAAPTATAITATSKKVKLEDTSSGAADAGAGPE